MGRCRLCPSRWPGSRQSKAEGERAEETMVAERRPAAAEPEARAAQLVCVLAALVAAAPVAEAKAEGGGPFHLACIRVCKLHMKHLLAK